jgi:hypothetical protein
VELGRPARLQAATIALINRRDVPAALQEPLLARVNAYAESPTPARRREVADWLRENSR